MNPELQPESLASAWERLQAVLGRFVSLSEEELATLQPLLQYRFFAKGATYLHSGQVCQKIGFLVSGITRVFYLEDGKEFSSYFNFQDRNPFVSSFTSFLTQTPSRESIHFLENSVLLEISAPSLEQLYASSATFQELGRKMAEFNYILAMERIYSLQHQRAVDRYHILLDTYPNLVNRIPHHYIASYLGITPEALSRLRRELRDASS